jgi:hypothetical protein
MPGSAALGRSWLALFGNRVEHFQEREAMEVQIVHIYGLDAVVNVEHD